MCRFNHAYYNMGQSLVTDQEYDVLFAELQKLEIENPKLASANSPTKKYASFFHCLFFQYSMY